MFGIIGGMLLTELCAAYPVALPGESVTDESVQGYRSNVRL